MSGISWALIASLGYGLSIPLFKLATERDCGEWVWIWFYGLFLLMIGTFSGPFGTKLFLPEDKTALLLVVVSAALCAVGLKANAIAISVSQASVVSGIAITYPVIVCLIEIFFMKGAEKMLLWKVVLGILLVVSGAFLLSTAGKQS